MNNSNLINQKRTLLQAVRVLTDNGHHDLAQAVWDAAIQPRKVLLPGEHK